VWCFEVCASLPYAIQKQQSSTSKTRGVPSILGALAIPHGPAGVLDPDLVDPKSAPSIPGAFTSPNRSRARLCSPQVGHNDMSAMILTDMSTCLGYRLPHCVKKGSRRVIRAVKRLLSTVVPLRFREIIRLFSNVTDPASKYKVYDLVFLEGRSVTFKDSLMISI
jgi:hypothetical protein